MNKRNNNSNEIVKMCKYTQTWTIKIEDNDTILWRLKKAENILLDTKFLCIMGSALQINI